MADKLLVLGESGSGKTYSMRNLDPSKTFYICPDEKELPFKGGESKYVRVYDGKNTDWTQSNRMETTNFNDVYKMLQAISSKDMFSNYKYVVIDTFTNMLVDDFMSRAKEKNWEKFTDFASNAYSLVELLRKLRNDLTVILFAHSEYQDRNGQNFSDLFIPGGKLTRKSKLESKFTVVLESHIEYPDSGEEPQYYFRTNNYGDGIAKSPVDMFESYLIPNDLSYVLEKMEEFKQAD